MPDTYETKSIQPKTTDANTKAFREGLHDGVPIGLGYFAVSFSLGIAAANAGLTSWQACLASLLCNASAGEYAGFSLIAAGASYFETGLMSFIANARYMLMSFAMSQRVSPDLSIAHRVCMGYGITDELFAIAIAKSGYLNPFYSYGAMLTSLSAWAAGTFIGAAAGNILPRVFVSAFSVALYGMFLAVIIPAAKKDKVVATLILISFALSFIANEWAVFSVISEGTRTILLTVLISAAAALLFPVK